MAREEGAVGRAHRTVCFYTDTHDFGGAEQSLLTLISGLDRSRWRPILAFHDSPGIARLRDGAADLDVELWAVPGMPEGAAGAARAVAFAAGLRRRRLAVFHAHLTYQLACKYGLAAAVLAHVPAVLATYQLLVDARVTRPTQLQQRALARFVGLALVVSKDIGGYLETSFGWRRDKIRLIHNAVPTGGFQPAADRLRRTLSPDGKPIVLTLARLDPLKGHQFLLEAAAAVPDARFVFAGAGPEQQSLERRARELGITGRVSFLGARDDVAELLACADVMALPSLAEGLPLAILEAMAAEVPVVATPVGDVDEAIRDGETGLLVAPGDSTALARALQELLADSALRTRLGKDAAAHVKARFDATRMVALVTAAYADLLGDRGRGDDM